MQKETREKENQNDLCDERIIKTSASEDRGSEVEEVVGTSKLLTGLECHSDRHLRRAGRSKGTRNTNDDRLADQVVKRDVGIFGVVLLELDAGLELGALLDVALDGSLDLVGEGHFSSKLAAKQLDAACTESSQDETEQTVVEDFAAVVGLIKRKNFTIREPAFFPFDLVTLDEFTNWRSAEAHAAANRTFSKRLESLESLVSFFESDAREQKRQSLVRKLSQTVVSTTACVEEMLATASQRGWEGLVLRQDAPYEGKRTSAIRKFKEWKDAEYTVQAITVTTMRLPIGGRFQEHKAMASIQIEHKGTRVSVGSGFTPDQRVEFANDPDKIVGKIVTVEYFDESKTTVGTSGSAEPLQSEDGQGEKADSRKQVYSLRFPRLKQIWGLERDL